jgi:RHS repeat-associated protein
VLQDGQGSNRITTNNDGTIREIITFDAFGNRAEGFGHNATDPVNLSHLYVGEHYDSESGFYHLRARDYDPAVGRFTARDEFEGIRAIPLSRNQYIYAHADPVNNIDPSGKIIGGFVSAFSNFSISMAVRLTLFGGRLAAQFPKLSGAIGFIASIMMPMELHLAAGQANFSGLGAASFSAMWQGARQLTQTAQQFQRAGNFIGEGKAFEEAVAAILRITKNTDAHRIKLPGKAQESIFYPDYVWGSGLLEVKTSAGAINFEQAVKYTAWMREKGQPVTYFFYKKPTESQLIKLEKDLIDRLGPGEVPSIAYLFK